MSLADMSVAGILNAQESDLIDNSGQPLVSLEDRFIQAYAQKSVSADQEKAAAMSMVEPGQFKADPAALFELQQKISDYGININLISTLARKATDAVSTLLK